MPKKKSSVTLRIPRHLFNEMIAHVSGCFPEMATGVLDYKGNNVIEHTPIAGTGGKKYQEALDRALRNNQRPGIESLIYSSYTRKDPYQSPHGEIDPNNSRNIMYMDIVYERMPAALSVRIFIIDEHSRITEGTVTLTD